MRASAADPIAVLSTPDDIQLMSVTRVAAALDCTERKARQVLKEERVPTVRLGARSGGVRPSHVRRLLEKRER